MTLPDTAALLYQATSQLNKTSDTPALDAELLFCAISGIDRSAVTTGRSMTLTNRQREVFSTLIKRRTAGEPIAYLLRRKEFWSQDLLVSPEVLIPRPETELLVEQALEHLPEQPCNVADLGTGSGAIALAIATERPNVQVTATDISQSALEVAMKNAARLGVRNVTFRQGDWFAPLADQHYRLIVSNPPYVRVGDPRLEAGTLYEPVDALISGYDGLDALRMICAAARRYLNSQGVLVLEHACDQKNAVHKLLSQGGFETIVSSTDLAGKPRVTWGRRQK
ncbi:MAG TPA: peptide chain release factor N(5)-glutamine methyltransferase [Gammaproteobacteria bacterium]|jgi:release factor glutamine methyltransferase|nr:MAG: peptide chain release factor N(5)-glutamine methyltransferase [Gammaproteobacteria bacterium]HIM89083.1 peptide chain release factor N(5)-glutamine methyltransferase [Gammaproteobacteria bacterium]HIM98982.1 peptide chain release factor N(5)-glutamine methyltransferase [Gammaproteobacteria bacterium]HIO17081.1 peptide chain release factor N(5)-glutamine methyltransferase [Gammaproteobacteria bacterium]HIP05460.1 peptide chain release factor N(5)-glutamine methyltransferase [Gammaproteob